jgi:hypothetical protein
MKNQAINEDKMLNMSILAYQKKGASVLHSAPFF